MMNVPSSQVECFSIWHGMLDGLRWLEMKKKLLQRRGVVLRRTTDYGAVR